MYRTLFRAYKLSMTHSRLVNSLTSFCFSLNVIFVRIIQECILTHVDLFFTEVYITFGRHTTVYLLFISLITYHFQRNAQRCHDVYCTNLFNL